MNCFKHYYYLGQLQQQVFDNIQDILKNYEDFKIAGMETGETKNRDNPLVDNRLRKSEVCFVNDERMCNIIYPLIQSANQFCSWNFDLTIVEHFQNTRYGIGEFYDWHVDEQSWPMQYRKDTIRKLSFTLLLNDDFEGGEFEMQTDGRTEQFSLYAGSMIVFHSDTPHRVAPVTSGVRKSLVGWIQGPPWK